EALHRYSCWGEITAYDGLGESPSLLTGVVRRVNSARVHLAHERGTKGRFVGAIGADWGAKKQQFRELCSHKNQAKSKKPVEDGWATCAYKSETIMRFLSQ